MDDLLRKRAEWFISVPEGSEFPKELREPGKSVHWVVADTFKRLVELIDDYERIVKEIK